MDLNFLCYGIWGEFPDNFFVFAGLCGRPAPSLLQGFAVALHLRWSLCIFAGRRAALLLVVGGEAVDAVFYEAEGGFGHLVGGAGGDVGEPDFYYAEDTGDEEAAGYFYFVFTCVTAETVFDNIEGFLVYDFL